MKVSVAQSCLILWDLMDCNSPGSSVQGISQARILEWIAIAFSRGSSWRRDWTLISLIMGMFFTFGATNIKRAVMTINCQVGWSYVKLQGTSGEAELFGK